MNMNYILLSILTVSFSILSFPQSFDELHGYKKTFSKKCEPEIADFFVIDAETGDLSQFNNVSNESGISFSNSLAAKHNCKYGFSITSTVQKSVSYYCYAEKEFGPASEIYIRFFIYFSNSFDLFTDVGYSNLLLLATDESDIQVLSLGLTSRDASTELSWTISNESTELGSYTSAEDMRDKWIEVKIYYFADESDAQFGLYLDDVQVINADREFSPYWISKIRIGAVHYSSVFNAGDFIYLDDFVGW